jgi:hypothetical protein
MEEDRCSRGLLCKFKFTLHIYKFRYQNQIRNHSVSVSPTLHSSKLGMTMATATEHFLHWWHFWVDPDRNPKHQYYFSIFLFAQWAGLKPRLPTVVFTTKILEKNYVDVLGVGVLVCRCWCFELFRLGLFTVHHIIIQSIPLSAPPLFNRDIHIHISQVRFTLPSLLSSFPLDHSIIHQSIDKTFIYYYLGTHNKHRYYALPALCDMPILPHFKRLCIIILIS